MTFKHVSPGATFWMRTVRYIKTQKVVVSDIPYNAVCFGTGAHTFVGEDVPVLADHSELYCPVHREEETPSSMHVSSL
jgi:hypothetical protein